MGAERDCDRAADGRADGDREQDGRTRLVEPPGHHLHEDDHAREDCEAAHAPDELGADEVHG